MEQLLAKLAAAIARFTPEPAFIPATEAELAALGSESLRRLGAPVPPGYVQLLAITNGLIWNGLTVFAASPRRLPGEREVVVPSFVEENEGIRLDCPHFVDYLVFARNDLDDFVYRIPDGQFLVLSRVGEDVFATFPDFESLISSAIERALPT